MATTRAVIEDYYDIQKMRIEVQGQIRSIEQGKAEGNEAFLRENVLPRLKDIEKDIVTLVKRELKDIDIWTEWLEDVKGIGPILAGGLVAWVEDPAKFAYPSSLWKYSGLDVVQTSYDEGVEEKLQNQLEKLKLEPEEQAMISKLMARSRNDYESMNKLSNLLRIYKIDLPTGAAPKRKAAQKITWNPTMRTLCWKIGESFVKNKNRSQYGELYAQIREDYEKKFPEPIEVVSIHGKKYNKYTNAHKHAMAKRKTVKIFLCHFLNKWKELRGLEVTKPWIVTHGGHQDYINPFTH